MRQREKGSEMDAEFTRKDARFRWTRIEGVI